MPPPARRLRSPTAALIAAALIAGCPQPEPPDPEPTPRPPTDWQAAFDPAPVAALPTCDERPDFVVTGDLDRDGHVDLAVSVVTEDLCLYRGLGDGTFELAAVLQDDPGDNPLGLGDLDGDGWLDVTAGNIGGQDFPIFSGRADFAFDPPVRYDAGIGPFVPLVVDVDGDGRNDIAVTNSYSDDVSVLLADPAGGLQDEVRWDAPAVEPNYMDTGDLDGDGALDLVHSNFGSDNVAVHWGDGTGGFGATSDLPTGALPASAEVADLDGDGDLDVITANEDSADLSLMYSGGDRSFAQTLSVPVGERPYYVVAADLDGDGPTELVVPLEGEGLLAILAAAGDGFEVVVTLEAGQEPSAVAVDDLDGDGWLDLVVTNYRSDDLSVFLNVLE